MINLPYHKSKQFFQKKLDKINEHLMTNDDDNELLDLRNELSTYINTYFNKE